MRPRKTPGIWVGIPQKFNLFFHRFHTGIARHLSSQPHPCQISWACLGPMLRPPEGPAMVQVVALIFVALCASAAGQDCSQLIFRSTVRTNRNQRSPQAPEGDSVVFSCTAQTASRDTYVAATAYIAGYLLDYQCTSPDGWEIIGTVNTSEVHVRDVPDGTCQACVVNAPDTSTTSTGHCQRESLYMLGQQGRRDNTHKI